MALRAVRGTWDRFVGLTTSPDSRISRCGCSRGAGSFTRLPSTSCTRTCSVRPAGGRSAVRSRARSGRTSGWAARTPRTRLRLEPLLSMPTNDDIDPLYRTCSASPKRGGDGPVWGSWATRICIPFGYTEKHALYSIRLHYAGVHHWMSFT